LVSHEEQDDGGDCGQSRNGTKAEIHSQEHPVGKQSSCLGSLPFLLSSLGLRASWGCSGRKCCSGLFLPCYLAAGQEKEEDSPPVPIPVPSILGRGSTARGASIPAGAAP